MAAITSTITPLKRVAFRTVAGRKIQALTCIGVRIKDSHVPIYFKSVFSMKCTYSDS